MITLTLALLLPVPAVWVIMSNSNISKTVRANIEVKLFKEYSTSFLMVFKSIDFALVVPKLLILKVCGIIGISKTEFFIFSWY